MNIIQLKADIESKVLYMKDIRKPIDKLNIHDLKWEEKYVGNLTQEMIDALNSRGKGSISISKAEIHVGRDRLKHFEKHKEEFINEDSYIKSIENLPEIINTPNYIGIHPGGDGVEFIKRLDENVMVAVRIKAGNTLWVRSIYPVTESRLTGFKNSGRCIEFCSGNFIQNINQAPTLD